MVGTCANSCGYLSTDAVLDFSYPTYPDLPTPITDGVADVSALAFDGAGNMLVANCTTCMTTPVYSVTKYAPGSTSPSVTIMGGARARCSCAFPRRSRRIRQRTSLSATVRRADERKRRGVPGSRIRENGTLFFNGLGYQPEEMLIDGVDDIIVSDTDSVQLSAPPYSSRTEVPSRPDATTHTYQGYALSP